MKIGVLAEEKGLDDKRTPLTPKQCKMLLETYPNLELVVKSSTIRCFSDEMYIANGIDVVDDLSDCDVLIGIKEVPIKSLIAEKTYFYFPIFSFYNSSWIIFINIIFYINCIIIINIIIIVFI